MKKRIGFPTNIVLLSTGIIFILLTVTMFISNTVIIFLLEHGIMDRPPEPGSLLPFLLRTGMISILTGTILTLCIGHLPLRPLYTFMQAIHSVSEGDFQTKIYLEHPKEFRELSRCFNQMTEELAGIELLRSDFINNFSHEFKTPIVSIAGFAKLLKRGNLTEEQKKEYLDVIEEESLRLSYMATNVLSLTQVENQTILTDVSRFNLSEQLRSCILLLVDKWEKKELDFEVEFGEYMISANEELLKQVWINLIDNAIKFSPNGGVIEIDIEDQADQVSVSVANSGEEISLENQKRIFNKFYQADGSHSIEGNGIGLAVVKRVVDLHSGRVAVHSEHNITAFTVMLPKNLRNS